MAEFKGSELAGELDAVVDRVCKRRRDRELNPRPWLDAMNQRCRGGRAVNVSRVIAGPVNDRGKREIQAFSTFYKSIVGPSLVQKPLGTPEPLDQAAHQDSRQPFQSPSHHRLAGAVPAERSDERAAAGISMPADAPEMVRAWRLDAKETESIKRITA